MQKPAKILLCVSVGVGLLYAIASLIGMIISGSLNPIGTPDSSAYMMMCLLYSVEVVIPLVVKFFFALIIFFSLKEKKEKIITEIIALITFSGIFSLLSGLINNLSFIFIAKIGERALVTYNYMSKGISWAGFLWNISTVLFIVAVSFSIAYKKIELPDLRRIIEEEES